VIFTLEEGLVQSLFLDKGRSVPPMGLEKVLVLVRGQELEQFLSKISNSKIY